jgi:hypothetical protein
MCLPSRGEIHLALCISKARKARPRNKRRRSPSFYFFENSPMWDEVDGEKGDRGKRNYERLIQEKPSSLCKRSCPADTKGE